MRWVHHHIGSRDLGDCPGGEWALSIRTSYMGTYQGVDTCLGTPVANLIHELCDTISQPVETFPDKEKDTPTIRVGSLI